MSHLSSITNQLVALKPMSMRSYGFYQPDTHMEALALNLQKFEALSEFKRTVILTLLNQYGQVDHSFKKVIQNTLECYNLLEDKEVLNRKRKINELIEDEN